jgi:hypothetical protein
MPIKRRTNGGRTKSSQTQTDVARGLERRVRRLERELAAVQAAHERKLELVRRAANRRLAAMMKEIAELRHHEARAEALERLLAARPTAAPMEGTVDGEDPRLPG